MTMWFYDDYGEMEDYKAFRKQSLSLEKEYLELRVLLRDAEAALRAEPDNADLKAKVDYLDKRVKDLEKQAAWLTGDRPLEYDLWGSPH
ncbi:MAG: hypothetical protein PHW74_09335 [Desulfobacca sp.]|nr:hypothetical protein [Desulfobacca sp.]